MITYKTVMNSTVTISQIFICNSPYMVCFFTKIISDLHKKLDKRRLLCYTYTVGNYSFPKKYIKEITDMAKNTPWTGAYEALPKIAKILLQIFLGGLIGGIYRIVRFLETKNIVTLVVGILVLVTGIGNLIVWVIDLITEITQNKITVLAD